MLPRNHRRPSRLALFPLVLVAAVAATVLVVAEAGGAPKVAQPTSPLDPLSASELRVAVGTIRADPRFPKGALFPIVTLLDQSKSGVLAWKPGRPFARRAFADVYDEPRNRLYEVVVDVRKRDIVSWTRRTGVQPAVGLSEYALAQAIIRRDPRFRHSMRIRGLNPKDVYLDVWALGDLPVTGVRPGARLLRGIADYRGKLPNVYDRPIEGVSAVVDMNRRKVVSFADTGVRPVAKTISGAGRRVRAGLKPLIVKQPQGPSFAIHGTQVTWRNWRFRVGFTPREGLVLNQIGWSENGHVRPIIYRMSFDDIYVPYSIPLSNWAWRAAFDIAEYDLGQYSEELQRNVDVPSNAVFLDEATAYDDGSVSPLRHAVALYEQDAGSLWDRADPDTGVRDARFGRELVVTSAMPIGNYTYDVEYVFRLDGGIDVRVASTGTTLNEGVASPAQGTKYGAMVGPHIAAPAHQHYFNFRIDFDVDGAANRVVEQNIHTLGRGNAFAIRRTPLVREQWRNLRDATGRDWLVESTTRRNAFGLPTAYELVPQEATHPYSTGYAPLAHAPFAQHTLWVTDYRPSEAYATGAYPNQARLGQGLARYAADGGNVDGRDLVVWYTASFTHIPVPENYPVMTTEAVGFDLRPHGFFNHDPALDAP